MVGRGGGVGWLTDADEEEEDEEDVEDGEEGHGEGRDDLAEGLDAAEDADDAEGAEDAHDAGGLCADDGGDEGGDDDEGVEDAPGVAHKGEEPVGVGVDYQLHAEQEREEEVKALEEYGVLRAHGGVGAVNAVQLRLEDGAHEVLPTPRGQTSLEGRTRKSFESLPRRSSAPRTPGKVWTHKPCGRATGTV